jgi:hypothetical protein
MRVARWRKLAWARAARREGVSLAEFLRRAANERAERFKVRMVPPVRIRTVQLSA